MCQKLMAWVLLAAAMLSGCGGGSDGGDSPFPGGSDSKVAELRVSFDTTTLLNDGTESASVTVTAVNSKSTVLANVPVTLSASCDGVGCSAHVTTTTENTDENGEITGVVTVDAGAASGSVITITATSGSVSDTGSITVVSDDGTVVSSVIMVLSSATLPNTGGDVVTATVTTLDENRNVIAGVPVTFSVNDDHAVITPSGPTTDDSGIITAKIGIGDDQSNRSIQVFVQAGSLAKISKSFQITGAKISATVSSPTVVPGAINNKIDYQVTNITDDPMVIQPVTITVTSPTNQVTTVTGTTNGSGIYTYTYTAPTDVGELKIVANAAGVTNTQSIQVKSDVIPAVTDTVTAANVQASPSVVSINTSDTDNQSVIRALFAGDNNKPIPNVRVMFYNKNKNNVGGTLGSDVAGVPSLVYSNADGIASTTYRPGSRSSPTDGVTIHACWDEKEFTAAQCKEAADALDNNQSPPGDVQAVKTDLTVAAEALSVTIGTNELLDISSNELTYLKQYVVMVVDSAGKAVSDVAISGLLDLPAYRQGFYIWNEKLDPKRWTKSVDIRCEAEDKDRNGNLNDLEDVNGSGILEPRKADASIVFVNGQKTASDGTLVVQIQYPKNVATWVDYQITVTATGVTGTEGKASYSGTLPALADDILKQTVPPAFEISPYGATRTCP